MPSPCATPVEIPRITTKPLVQKYATRDVPRGVDWDQNFKDYVDALRACAEACEQGGRHDVGRAASGPLPRQPRRRARGCSSTSIIAAMGINFDPSHTFPVGDYPNISVYRLGKHIIHLHVSDNDGVTNVHWRPGMGKIDWVAMFQALKDIGYDGVVSIELEDVPGTSRAARTRPPRASTGTSPRPTSSSPRRWPAMNYLKGICKELDIPVD